MSSTATEINKIANELETLGSTKEASNKISALIEPGTKIICVNPVQGIYKGRCYIAHEYIEPNVIVINDETSGESIGAFNANRFCIDWNAF